jgi:hypothetical protein
MRGSERLDPPAGPLANLGQAYFSGVDMMMKGYEPVLKGVGRWQLEIMGLATRRAQAWMQMPAQVSRCKTPQEFANEQVRFWQTAASQYVEGAQRLLAVMGASSPIPTFNGAWKGEAEGQSRDYITFPEAKESEVSSAKRRDRKAA